MILINKYRTFLTILTSLKTDFIFVKYDFKKVYYDIYKPTIQFFDRIFADDIFCLSISFLLHI